MTTLRMFPGALALVLATACDTKPAATADTSAPPATASPADVDSAAKVAVTGVGALRIGMTGSEATVATNGALSVTAARETGECRYATWSAAPRGVRAMFTGDTLVRLDVREPGVPTVEGLEVGATVAQADSMYGERAERRPHKYTNGSYRIVQPLAPSDTTHRLVIELDTAKVTAYRVGRYPEVEYVEGCS